MPLGCSFPQGPQKVTRSHTSAAFCHLKKKKKRHNLLLPHIAPLAGRREVCAPHPSSSKKIQSSFRLPQESPLPGTFSVTQSCAALPGSAVEEKLIIEREKKKSQLALSLSHRKQVRNKRQLQEEAAPRHPLSEALFHTQSTLLHRPAAESTRGRDKRKKRWILPGLPLCHGLGGEEMSLFSEGGRSVH